MISTGATEAYLQAMHLGQKEKKKLEAAGKSPFPPALEELYPETGSYAVQELPVQEIPIDRIVGTAFESRMNVFSASFFPLPEPGSEFATKWAALCDAHLSDTGIRDPIECYEYLGNFYVIEGNKRTSVLKHFGALRVSAKIKRIMPADKDDKSHDAYYEFLGFHRLTGLYDVQFKNPGEYAKLIAALGKKPGEEWTSLEISEFSAFWYRFKEAFSQFAGDGRDILPEDALLLSFRVYTYVQLAEMSQQDLIKALQTIWGDLQVSSEPEALTVQTSPENEEKKGVLGKLITVIPRHLNIAFIYRQDVETSTWTNGHSLGAGQMADALGNAVSVKEYFHADTAEEADELLEKAVQDGAEVIFTTTPPLLHSALKAAVKYPKISFFNCSANKPLSSVRSYYCRTYEGKFITGLIAGALAQNGLVGYIGSYPILGVPAAINAFALGVGMTNPRAKVLLEWSCLPGDGVDALYRKGVRVISNRDVPLPDVSCMDNGAYGTVIFDENGAVTPLASPCWMWGRLYEKIVRSIIGGGIDKKERTGAVNYWWGMDSGVIDIIISETLPVGVKRLADHFTGRLKKGAFDPFMQKLVSQDGSLICTGEEALTSMEILLMDRLSDTVIGSIPEYDELLPISKALVRELILPGRGIPPDEE